MACLRSRYQLVDLESEREPACEIEDACEWSASASQGGFASRAKGPSMNPIYVSVLVALGVRLVENGPEAPKATNTVAPRWPFARVR